MSQNPTNFKNSGVRGNVEQYTVNGPYTRNTGGTYHNHNAPTYHYTTNANGAPVVNGAFNGVQYNISSPSQNRHGETPYFPVNPSQPQHNQEPEDMEDFPQSPSDSQDNSWDQTRSWSGDSATDIFESYNQPSSNAQWGNQYEYGNPTRPSPVPSQRPPRSYTAPAPPGHATHPYNPYYPHPQSDPVVPQHPPHFNPSNAGESGYPNSHFDHGSQSRAFAGPDSSRGPQNAKPSRRETNPFVRLIEDQQRNPEKPRGYFQ